jgi:hypothetical protein
MIEALRGVLLLLCAIEIDGMMGLCSIPANPLFVTYPVFLSADILYKSESIIKTIAAKVIIVKHKIV